MDTQVSSNGHHPDPDDTSRRVNQYVDAVKREHPREIVDFEMDTDPYANMLPGISNIRAARTVGEGLEAGRRGNRLIMAISFLLLVVLILPGILAIISQLKH